MIVEFFITVVLTALPPPPLNSTRVTSPTYTPAYFFVFETPSFLQEIKKRL